MPTETCQSLSDSTLWRELTELRQRNRACEDLVARCQRRCLTVRRLLRLELLRSRNWRRRQI